MNKKQKIIIIISISLVIISLIVWLNYGGKFFTQTKVLVDKKDKLFGNTYKVWENKFVLGLDYTLIFDAATLLISGTFFFLFRKKKSLVE